MACIAKRDRAICHPLAAALGGTMAVMFSLGASSALAGGGGYIADGLSPVINTGVTTNGSGITQNGQAIQQNYQRVESAERSINDQIAEYVTKGSNQITDGLEAQTNIQQKLLEAIKDRLAELATREATLEARKDIQANYGGYEKEAPVEKAQVRNGICRDANATAGTAEGEDKAADVNFGRLEAIDNRQRDPDKPIAEKVVEAAKFTVDDLKVDKNLMGGSYTAEAMNRKDQLVEQLIDWVPPKALSENSQKTPHGLMYQSALNERRARLEASAGLIVDRASKTDPVYDQKVGWMKEVYEKTGYGETKKGGDHLFEVEKAGALTYDDVLHTSLLARSMLYENNVKRVEKMVPAELLREQVKQLALANQIAYDQLRLDQRLALLAASEKADKVGDEYEDDLDQLRQRAIVPGSAEAGGESGS